MGHGARAVLPRLPGGPRDRDGAPTKQAIDDFIRQRGDEAFRQWAANILTPTPERSLDSYRQELQEKRIRSLVVGTAPGSRRRYNCCRAPTGAGKSFADGATLSHMQETPMNSRQMHSLTVVPTHSNCAEAVEDYASPHEVRAWAYPQHNRSTCENFEEAHGQFTEAGLDFHAGLCPWCPYRKGCTYRRQYNEAAKAQHTIATQARLRVGMKTLTKDRQYITVHEDAIDVLRPMYSAPSGFRVIELVAKEAAGNTSGTDRAFYLYMAAIARYLHGEQGAAYEAISIAIPESAHSLPRMLHRELHKAAQMAQVYPPALPMRLCLAVLEGKIDWLGVIMEKARTKKGELVRWRNVLGRLRNELPTEAVKWLSDATLTNGLMEAACGEPVADMTPLGRLKARHPALQIIPARDITIGRKATEVLPILKGILYDLPFTRLGVLTHKHLAEELPELLAEQAQRVAKWGYFYGGLTRGTNVWPKECDCLIVLGAPRVHPSAVRQRLPQLSYFRAFSLTEEAAGWGPDYWSGVTQSGKRLTVPTLHYADHDWHEAHWSIVCAEMLQAVGRGRGILPGGIPVYVVSNENLAPPYDDDGLNGLILADWPFDPLTEPQLRLAALSTGNGRHLVLLAYTVTTTEAQAHRRLRRWRVRGEWYRALVPEVLSEIESWTWLSTTELQDLRRRICRE
jgi:hypothetical protein